MNQGKVLRVIILIIGQETNANISNTNSNTSISNNNKIKKKIKKKENYRKIKQQEGSWLAIYSTSIMVAIGVVDAAVFMPWCKQSVGKLGGKEQLWLGVCWQAAVVLRFMSVG